MYPIKFENLYYDKIWGGRDLENFRSNLPSGDIGESWDVACHENGMSIVANGIFKGKTLKELMKEQKEKLLGSKMDKEFFPLLIKLINSNDSLSVQVHPNDEYAKRVENDMGKTEVWYVVDAKPGATLIVGTKEGVTKEQFKESIENGTLEDYMNVVEVNKGEIYFIKSGLMHAIGKGLIIAEIQQNSDTTYRVYDYNRGRELHVEKALDVVNLSLKGERSKGLKIQGEDYDKTYHCLCREFALEEYKVKTKLVEKSDEERFYIFTCVDGNGIIKAGEHSEEIKAGDSYMIPANCGEYEIVGTMKLLKSYVPDIETVEKEIIGNIKK